MYDHGNCVIALTFDREVIVRPTVFCCGCKAQLLFVHHPHPFNGVSARIDAGGQNSDIKVYLMNSKDIRGRFPRKTSLGYWS